MRLDQAAYRDERLAESSDKAVRVCQALANASDVRLRQKVWDECKKSQGDLKELAVEIFEGAVLQVNIL